MSFYEHGVAHKRGPFLNVLRIFWGKKHKRNTVRDVSTFSRKASSGWPQHKMVPHVSVTFRPMTLKNKFKVFAVPRFNKITLPSQIALCELLLVKHQRLMLFKPDCDESHPLQFRWGSRFKILCGLVCQQVDIGFLVKHLCCYFPTFNIFQ